MDTALRRAVTRVLEGCIRQRWGFPPHLIAPMVRQLGALPALRWFAWNLPRYERTLHLFGPVRTHLLVTAVSLVNGCRYCCHGHGAALQLAYLRDHGKLFPLSEDDLEALRGKPAAQIRYKLLDAVRKAELHSDAVWLDRVIELTVNQHPVEHDDLRIAHLSRMISALNAAAIKDDTELDEAHDSVNKDARLKERYRALRAASAA
jgi:hypothetical protein